MEKVTIDPFDLVNITLSRTSILVSKGKNKVNMMALDWKSIGTLWGDPVCVVAVAPSRYTFELLNNCKQFTLNVPSEEMNSAVSIAGSYSGRNVDKIKKAGLTLVEARSGISVPVIDEAIINYECKIIHTSESGSICSHRLFFGEIYDVYADEQLVK
ncbi:MAG: flavin reductase family protein [Candidatus Helarchaeota archaeon]